MNHAERQDVFNRVAKHLLNQGVKSTQGFGRCAYRGKDGTKCALGALIDNKIYRPGMEGGIPSIQMMYDLPEDVKVTVGLLSSGVIIENQRDVDFLLELQGIHDIELSIVWKDRLKEFARIHRLSFKDIEE